VRFYSIFFFFFLISPFGFAITFTTGGDVNVKDGDGDTPIYTVENIETARYLVDHGAVIAIKNNEGKSVSPFESWLSIYVLF
jgi:hypothetical protein